MLLRIGSTSRVVRSYPCSIMRGVIKTLREIETNRLVKIWEPADWQLYQQTVERIPAADRRAGVMPGSLWSESGFVYCSVVPEDVPI